jgi:hypothetical protein
MMVVLSMWLAAWLSKVEGVLWSFSQAAVLSLHPAMFCSGLPTQVSVAHLVTSLSHLVVPLKAVLVKSRSTRAPLLVALVAMSRSTLA